MIRFCVLVARAVLLLSSIVFGLWSVVTMWIVVESYQAQNPLVWEYLDIALAFVALSATTGLGYCWLSRKRVEVSVANQQRGA